MDMPIQYYREAEKLREVMEGPYNGLKWPNNHRTEMTNIWCETLGIKTSRARYRSWSKLLGFTLQEGQKFRSSGFPKELPFDDHTTLWNKGGVFHIWLSQPYDFNFEEVSKVAENVGLDVEVPEYPSWHYPGSTKMLIWTKRQA